MGNPDMVSIVKSKIIQCECHWSMMKLRRHTRIGWYQEKLVPLLHFTVLGVFGDSKTSEDTQASPIIHCILVPKETSHGIRTFAKFLNKGHKHVHGIRFLFLSWLRPGFAISDLLTEKGMKAFCFTGAMWVKNINPLSLNVLKETVGGVQIVCNCLRTHICLLCQVVTFLNLVDESTQYQNASVRS